ncbi:hypothetical protein LCGC14_2371700, partial [marine sediment metagenome]
MSKSLVQPISGDEWQTHDEKPESEKGQVSTDSQWSFLLNSDLLMESQKQAEKRVDGYTTEEWQYLRKRAKVDLFFLIYGVLGYDNLTESLHGHLCSWLRRRSEDFYKLVLMPRGHYKTTICTIGDSIQIALPDDTGLEPFPRNLGPDVRILLGHETAEGASRFNYEITGHFVANPTLMGLFPECVPNPRHQRMNKRELELPRSIIRAEPTIDTMGVGGKSQGRHYDEIKLDDIFGDKARDSVAERETTIQWFDNIQSFFVRLAVGYLDMVGTRYSLDDVYEHVMEVYEEQIKRYIRRIEEYNENGELKAIFPKNFTPKRLAILRKNKKVWAAQYVNDPVEGLARFDINSLRYYERVGENKVAIFTGESSHVFNVRELDIVILADPAVSRLPGIVVTGASPKLQLFVLETYKEDTDPTTFVELLFRMVQRWWPRIVAIESVIFSAVYEHWIKREMSIRGISFNIIPYKPPPDRTKAERIMGLEPYLSAAQIYVHRDQKELIKEFKEFGATTNTHLLDALAQGPTFWRPGLDQATMDRNRKLEEEFIL